ncbi:hypothetical protein DFH09DRAFT_1111731 [Mycena vulgaris]|nr:hypothetical protein DFH09DRAFT_1111731 [Mycena vulgaris]
MERRAGRAAKNIYIYIYLELHEPWNRKDQEDDASSQVSVQQIHPVSWIRKIARARGKEERNDNVISGGNQADAPHGPRAVPGNGFGGDARRRSATLWRDATNELHNGEWRIGTEAQTREREGDKRHRAKDLAVIGQQRIGLSQSRTAGSYRNAVHFGGIMWARSPRSKHAHDAAARGTARVWRDMEGPDGARDKSTTLIWSRPSRASPEHEVVSAGARGYNTERESRGGTWTRGAEVARMARDTKRVADDFTAAGIACSSGRSEESTVNSVETETNEDEDEDEICRSGKLVLEGGHQARGGEHSVRCRR